MSKEYTPLQTLSEIQDLVDLNEFMQDEDFGEACDLALRCIAQPGITPATAMKAMVQMQGFAFKFKMMGLTYMTIKKGKPGTGENQKKNVYYAISEQCHELAQTLKYVVKEHV